MKTKIRKTGRLKPRSATAGTLKEGVRAFKREMILKTAMNTFYTNGYQNVSVDNIASDMSVSKAVIYYNFDTKEDILEAIIDRTTQRSREAIDRGIDSGGTPAKQLALACYSYADHMMKNQTMVGVYFREDRCFSPALRARTTKVEKSIAAKLAGLIAAGIACGEFRACDEQVTALTIMGMISMAYYWYREGGRLSRHELCSHFASQSLRLVGCDEAAAVRILAERAAR